MLPRLRWLVLLAALIAGAVASHAPVLDAGFVEFDDTGYVEGNPPVASGLRLENVRWALTGYQLSNWHPATWVSHMIDVEIYGLAPRGHHVTNLALHVLNVLLLFLLLRALTKDDAASLVVAGLFALHPVNVESVAWIAQRKTLLSTFFALLSIAGYARYTRGGGRLAYAGSLFCFAFSLLSKQMFVTMPLLLLLLDYWPLRRAALEPAPGSSPTLPGLVRGALRLLPDKLPYLGLGILASLITLHSQQDAMSTLEGYPLSVRLGNVALAYVRYLGIFFAPVRLAVFYPLYTEDLTPLRVGGCVAMLALITAGAFQLGRTRRYLLVGWLWFLVSLIPVIGLVQVGMQSMADRYAYVPFWGLAIALVWWAQDLLRRAPVGRGLRGAVACALALLFCGLGVLTHRQTESWHDSIALFEHAVANTERNWLAHSFLAGRYFAREDFQKAIAHSEEAIPYGRDMGTVRSTYGLALYETGSPEKAMEQFTLATLQAPEDPLGYMNLGWLYTERGEYDVALVRLATAADKIKKGTPPYTRKMIYGNWGNVLAKTNQLAASREKYDLALDADPRTPVLLRDAARVDMRLGDPARAADRLERALALDPQDVEAAYLLASAHALQAHPDQTAAALARAEAMDPRQVIVAIDLARTLAHDGRREEGARLLQDLLALPPPAQPADAAFVTSMLRSHLGEIGLEQGDVAGAAREIERAVAAWPDNYDANNRLAWLLATSADPALRDPARAVMLAERAANEKREYQSLATLAAAYASAGRRGAAVDTAREALDLATKANDERAIGSLQQQLQLYGGPPAGISGPVN